MEPDILLCGRVRTKLSSVLRMQTFKQGNLLYDKHIAVPLGSLHWGRVGIGLGSFIHIVRVSLVRGECAQLSVGPSLFLFASVYGSYLVDPARSHMLVSKIKPCMSKCK